MSHLVDDPTTRRDLQLDDQLVELRRFVEERTDLFVGSRDETALTLTNEQHERIEKSADALLCDERQRRWWVESDRWFAVSRRLAEDAEAGFRSLAELVREPRDDWRGLHQRLEAASVPADAFWFGPWRRNLSATSRVRPTSKKFCGL